ncbi:leucine-tRNA ligase [Fomitiporia mediterranea MF3/22]|uniref:leucine-tRNA ligase n=1 Tax=Fomitiporia mediterranea (strain MF3/22) TaxID=694068 RepID=UPI0004409931|nr:leucine-tRNA ligase [Fomitiporia mediterranea MF3/22]EJD05001.1 leucine-tRNA ligase [Fomitiporia mediterranea MF3/22]
MTTIVGDGPIALQQTGKRDALKAIEKRCQQRWEEEHVFEVDAPTAEQIAQLSPTEIRQKFPKWFGNFPYPYMNGSLHLGHAFTISKIEFGAGYQRLLGKRALFPHGFHCTGMPIKAASDKIIREMQMFGPDFEGYKEPEDDGPSAPPAPVSGAPASSAPDKAKKGKVVAKATGHTYQFQIMESIGVPRAEIKKFADPQYWLKYFPPIAVADQKALGTRIDWRRAFITTDANPYYDAFVRWQINKLYRQNKIKFGERYTVYSPKDGQPCMDHDRSEGEALGPQEYTTIKLEVAEWSEGAKSLLESKVGGRKVFLVAATLRPETMYGQTNCFVGTAIKYGVFAGKNNEAYVCTYRAARNMAFQGITETPSKVEQLAEVDGSALVGTKVKAAFSVNPEVYVLPMENVLATKGTGVVTSVPSDSPDDYATLFDLKKKPEYYKIKPEWCALDPIPVLSTPTYGEQTAPAIVKKLKINSQKDVKQLAEAKDIAYKEGFYNGTMLVGEFKGMSVQEAKPRVREAMIKAGLAFAYAEPEGFILSRSGDECVIALMDQWYLDYGEPTWRAQAEKLLARMNTYSTETRNNFEATLGWLNQWACARTYGLGTKLPWDPTFMVESLSDSTIYMSYYTIAHLLQGGVWDGSKPGPLGVTPEQMTDEVFEYLFCDGPWPSNTTLSKEKADVMKHEYNYFYPQDIRSSGKDLIPNHLTFAIYIHAAIFPEDKWPLSMRTNGHLMLNGKKMSKSTGNSLTLRESVEKFGADATRIALADAGDSIEDANFDEKNANANILRLHTLIDWCEEMMQEQGKMRKDRIYHDTVFENEINELIAQTHAHYEATNYKDALKYGFFELQMARDWYREVTTDLGMNADLVKYWIRVSCLLIAPIAPHFAEHIWSSVLGEPVTVQRALWPSPSGPVDPAIVEAGQYMRGTLKTMRDSEISMLKKLSKSKSAPYDPKKPKSARIYVATRFPEWQDRVVAIVKEAYDAQKDKVDDVKIRELLQSKGLIKDKRAMPFAQLFKKRIAQFGAKTAFQRSLPFSESAVLSELLPYLKKSLNLVDAEVLMVDDALQKEGPGFSKTIIEQAEPGSPAFEFRNV